MRKEEKERLEREYLGKKIYIVDMFEEPQYKGKKGYVNSVDDIGQLHGTWGGCALIPSVDNFYIISDND